MKSRDFLDRRLVSLETFLTLPLLKLTYDGYSLPGAHHCLLPGHSAAHQALRAPAEVRAMPVLYVVVGIIVVLLLVYLILALFKPEWFA